MKAKKIVSVLLAVVFMFSFMSISVMAEETVTTAEALKTALTNGGEVKLGGDITTDTTLTVPSGKSVVLDLAGYTISNSTASDFAATVITNKGTLTITGDGTLSGAYAAVYNSLSGTLTIENGTYDVADGYGLVNDGVATVNGGTFDGVGTYNPATLTINGGTFNIGNEPDDPNGAVYGKQALHIRPDFDGRELETEVTITGGTFNGDVYAFGGGWGTIAKFDISGGTFNGTFLPGGDEKVENLSITGGTFSEDVSVYCANGFVVTKNSDDTYGVAKDLPEAEVTVLDPLVLTAKEHNYMVWPRGDATIDRPLEIVMNFKAKDTVEEAVASGYSKWLTDFHLTVTGLKDGSITADNCYLAGNYGTFGWIVIPTDEMVIKDGVTYPVVAAYDATLNYNDICKSVKDFTAAIHIDDAILEANPDMQVKLELKMTNPDNPDEVLIIGEPAVYDVEDLKAPELPTATVTAIENDDLTFALNFKADEATAAQLAYYGDWYADYVLTVNKDVTFYTGDDADGYLSGQYDEWSENWINVPFNKAVEVKANEPVKIMELAAELMGKTGLQVTYNDVYTSVKDFDCGVFFTDEFLAANPDLEVTLELRMYNPADETVSYAIGETYEFAAADLAVAAIGETTYPTLQAAINAAQSGDTVTLLDNVTVSDTVTVAAGKNITLDLAGYTVSQTKAQTAAYSMIQNNGTLTIKDSVGNGKISYTDSGNGGEYVSNTILNNGTLTVDGGTIENQSSATVAGNGYPHAIDTNGELVINDGTITCANYSSIRIWCTTDDNTAVTINGGSIKGAVDLHNVNKNANKGTLTINGGTFTATNVLRYLNFGTIDAEISSSITGGTFNGNIVLRDYASAGLDEGAIFSITGGTYANDVTVYCADGYTCEANADGTYGVVEEVELFNLAGANMALDNSLNMFFYIRKSDLSGTDYYAVITKEYADGRGDAVKTIQYADWEVYNSSLMRVSFDGIAAKEMGDAIYVQVFNGDGTPASNVWEDSVRAYTTRLFTNSTNTYEKTLAADMLNYGADAQINFGYNTSDLANSQMTDEQKSLASEAKTYTDDRVKSGNYVGTSLTLENNIVMNFYFKDITREMTAKVEYTDYRGNEYVIDVNGADFVTRGNYLGVSVDTLVVADGTQPVTCTVYDTDGTAIGSVTDSIAFYSARSGKTENEQTLGVSVMKFVESAQVYLLNK